MLKKAGEFAPQKDRDWETPWLFLLAVKLASCRVVVLAKYYRGIARERDTNNRFLSRKILLFRRIEKFTVKAIKLHINRKLCTLFFAIVGRRTCENGKKCHP